MYHDAALLFATSETNAYIFLIARRTHSDYLVRFSVTRFCMDAVLRKNRFLIRRQVSLPWAGQHFDVLDPDTTQPVMECREQRGSWLRRIAQWLDWSAGMPGPVECSTPEGKVVLKIRKHFSLMSHCLSFENAYGCVLGKAVWSRHASDSQVTVTDAHGRCLGMLVRADKGWHYLSNGQQSAASLSVYQPRAQLLDIDPGLAPEALVRPLILGVMLGTSAYSPE